jgi:PAS domain S-box-containing protein
MERFDVVAAARPLLEISLLPQWRKCTTAGSPASGGTASSIVISAAGCLSRNMSRVGRPTGARRAAVDSVVFHREDPRTMTTPPASSSSINDPQRSARAQRATRFVHSRIGRAAIVGGPAALVLVFMLILRAAAERERTATALDAHAQQVRAETATFLAYLSDAEAGQRGFLLTRRPVYLAPFVSGRPFLDSSLARIRQLTRENPTQQARLDTLTALAHASLAFMDSTVEVRRNLGLDSAIARLETGRGRELMDEIRRIEQSVSDEDATLLATRLAAADAEHRRTLVWLLVGTVAAIAAALFANLILADASADEADTRAAVAARMEKLERSEEMLRSALAAGQTGTWDWDLRENRMTWSDVHEMMFGYRPGTFSGDPDVFFSRVHPDDRAALMSAIERARDQRLEYVHEFRIEPTPGTTHWIVGRGSFFYDDVGQPYRAAGTVADITSRKAVQAEPARTLGAT